MSVQLCLILVILVAIVITSTDSYDKMEELNRSAREVFFAIENQEAEGKTQDTDFRGVQDDPAQDAVSDKAAREGDITVERRTEEARNSAQTLDTDESVDNHADDAHSDMEDAGGETKDSDNDSDTEDLPREEEGILKPIEESSEQPEEQKPAQESEEENEEALSRSITRYYEVEQGDTLYTISQKIYGDISRVEEICEVNQISDPDKIHSGQRIILP